MRRKLYLIIFSFAIHLFVSAQQPSFSWAKSFGSTGIDAGLSIWIDADKNIYTVGNFVGTVDFDPGIDVVNLTSVGTKSAFVQKLNAAGELVWARAFGGVNSYAIPRAVTVDGSGNVIVGGDFLGTVDFDPSPAFTNNITSIGTGGGAFPSNIHNAFVLKLDVDGNFTWACNFGANTIGSIGGGQVNALATDNTNNIYVAGDFLGTVDFDPGPATINYSAGSSLGSAFIAKLDPAKNFSWANAFGNTCTDIKVYQNNLYLTGGALTGLQSINHLIVRKLDLPGNLIWEKTVFGNTNVIGASLCLDNNGNVITTGLFGGVSVDFDPGTGTDSVFILNSNNGTAFIQKLNPDGKFIWANNFSGITKSILATIDGNIFTTGNFSGTADFNPGLGTDSIFNLTALTGNVAFIQKLDASGKFKWAGQFGTSGNESGNSIKADDLKNIYITGSYSGTQDFNPSTGASAVFNLSSSSSSQDIFIVKLNDAIVLPVKLMSFTAIPHNDKALIEWKTTNEFNADNFEVQRSTSGTNFEKIGVLRAKNSTGENEYSFIDYTPELGNNFYRLKQTDFDGHVEYSKMVNVVFAKPLKTLMFPNPANQTITIISAAELKNIEVTDVNGKKILYWEPSLTNTYNISELPVGNYLIKLMYKNSYETIQLCKLDH